MPSSPGFKARKTNVAIRLSFRIGYAPNCMEQRCLPPPLSLLPYGILAAKDGWEPGWLSSFNIMVWRVDFT